MYTLPVLGRAFVIKNLPVEYGRSFRDLFNFMEDREVLNGQTASSTSGYVFQISKVTGGEREGILNGVMTRVVDGEGLRVFEFKIVDPVGMTMVTDSSTGESFRMCDRWGSEISENVSDFRGYCGRYSGAIQGGGALRMLGIRRRGWRACSKGLGRVQRGSQPTR